MQAAAKRLVAIKTRIIDLQASTPVRDPNGPTGLALPNGITAYRFNIIGAVVTQPEISDTSAAFVIDDSTGSLVIRAFENTSRLAGFKIGDIVNVIGRPRPASDGVFIAPEIVKATHPEWVAVRPRELHHLAAHYQTLAAGSGGNPQTPVPATSGTAQGGNAQATASIPRAETKLASALGVVEEEILIDERAEASPERRISNLIKLHDNGSGADAAIVISESNISNAEAIIDKLLKNGDIFAVGPGRYKILD